MLIMTRRVGEALLIGDDITLTILGVKGNHVRIGIECPNDLEVCREEIYNRMVDQSTDEATKEDKP